MFYHSKCQLLSFVSHSQVISKIDNSNVLTYFEKMSSYLRCCYGKCGGKSCSSNFKPTHMTNKPGEFGPKKCMNGTSPTGPILLSHPNLYYTEKT